MDGIKIHLDPTEQVALRADAESLGVDSEDIAYAALRRLMAELKAHPQQIGQEIVDVRDLRQYHHPVLGRSGYTAHPFEDVGNDYSVPGL